MIKFPQQRLLQDINKIRLFVFHRQCFNYSTINVSQCQKMLKCNVTQMMSLPRTGYSDLCEAMASFVTVRACREINKGNRCLARYSLRATTINQPKMSQQGLAQNEQKC